MQSSRWKGYLVALASIAALLGIPVTAQAEEPSFPAECPRTIKCVVVPAPYTDYDGVTDYGNYDRDVERSIDRIVIHDTEGSLKDTLEHFRGRTYVSIHYIVDVDGVVYQMVPTKDMPWHAGNWWINQSSIGIEHVGKASDGSSYTPAMYKSSAELVRYLTSRYNIERDRQHIVGHDNYLPARPSEVNGMHTDPGPFWNWQRYMALIGAPVLPSGGINSRFVTVAPTWPLSRESVTGCTPDTSNCVAPGRHSTNFVNLHEGPSASTPLVTDVATGQGTTEVGNNAARLFHGQTFAVADRKVTTKGVWHKVWVNGSTGWFFSSWAAPTALPAKGTYVTPKAGLESIPVYGRPIPERSEYPADLLATPPGSWYIPSPAPLQYEVKAGQKYSLSDSTVRTEHVYAWASDSSFPYDHTTFKGSEKYYEIQLGNRSAFVKAADVTVG